MISQTTNFVLLNKSSMRKDNLPFATTWMDLEHIVKPGKSEKDKHCITALTCEI